VKPGGSRGRGERGQRGAIAFEADIHPVPRPARSRLGEVVSDKYRIVRLLGEGGMGAVFEAQHTFVGRRFAVKFLHAQYADNPEVMARFQREAQVAGGLESENIAAVPDFGFASDGTPPTC
jgi:serine/threonine-protein kinase